MEGLRFYDCLKGHNGFNGGCGWATTYRTQSFNPVNPNMSNALDLAVRAILVAELLGAVQCFNCIAGVGWWGSFLGGEGLPMYVAGMVVRLKQSSLQESLQSQHSQRPSRRWPSIAM